MVEGQLSVPKIEHVDMPYAEGLVSEQKTQAGGFQKTLSGFLMDVNATQINADMTIQRLATGQTKDVHQVMFAIQEAKVAFDFMMKTRNTLMEAYKKAVAMSG